MTDTRFLQVDIQALKIRKTPAGEDSGEFLAHGDIIQVDYDNRKVSEGLIWVQHSQGWTAIRPEILAEGQRGYVRDITHTVPHTAQLLKVTYGSINVRKSPNGEPNEYMLKRGDVIIGYLADGGQPTEGGHIWWQHSLGWSSEKSSIEFMQRLSKVSNPRAGLTAPPEPLINPASSEDGVVGTTPEDDPTSVTNMTVSSGKKRYYYLAVDPPTARQEPYGAVYGYPIREGTVFTSYMSAAEDKGKHFWLQHVGGGWAASGPSGDKYQWLTPINEKQAEGLLPSLLTAENIDELPNYRALFTDFPTKLQPQKGYFQYFGNNVFAFTDGTKFGYDGYSQGLHGGLDFGNKVEGQDIFARVTGKVTHVIDRKGIGSNQVWVETDHYRIIYQHLINQSTARAKGKNPPSIGDPVTPDTYIGTYSDPVSTGLDHLHLEVRYLEYSNRRTRHKELIINPLELMPDALIQKVLDAYNPITARRDGKSELRYFYKSDAWNQWTTPLDQPVIQWAQDIIGPRAK